MYRCVLLALQAYFSYSQLDLLVIGDWGGMSVPPYTTPGQVKTSIGMNTVASKLFHLQAVLALGDNFYSEGNYTLSFCLYGDPNLKTTAK